MAENRTAKCPYCGNNPVPHFLHWYQESLSLLLEPLRRGLLTNPLAGAVKRRGVGQALGLAAADFLEKFGLLKKRGRKELCRVRRAQVLWEEAEKRGMRMQELLLFGRPLDIYIAERLPSLADGKREKAEGRRMIFSGLPRPTNLHSPNLELMDDKAYFRKLFGQNRLPLPAGGCAATFRQARDIFNRISRPAIVKPRSGSRGRHSTTFICSEKDLRQAVKAAKQLCYWVIVEEQLKGPVYRATVIDYKVQGVLRGDPPQVTGDGKKNIRQLIAEKNRQAPAGVRDIAPDGQMERFLARQNLNFESVPPAGAAISLLEKIGINYGGSSSEDFDFCHPDNLRLFERAARAVGDPIVGFDFIIEDIARSWQEQRCGFIEANSLPFINLHHDPLLGKPRNVAAAVWDMAGYKPLDCRVAAAEEK